MHWQYHRSLYCLYHCYFSHLKSTTVTHFFQFSHHLNQTDFNSFSMLLLVLSTKLLNFSTYLQFSSLFIGKQVTRQFNIKSFMSLTHHFILVIHLFSTHSYISTSLGQLVHHSSSHLVNLPIKYCLVITSSYI